MEESVSAAHCWLVLMKAHRSVQRYDDLSIAQTQLCFADFACLEALLHKGPMAVNEIGRVIQRTSGTMTALVDRLSQRGLLRRVPDPRDRRVQRVELTDEGRALIEPAFEAHQQRLEFLFQVFPSSQRRLLVDLLRQLGMRAQQLEQPANMKEEL